MERHGFVQKEVKEQFWKNTDYLKHRSEQTVTSQKNYTFEHSHKKWRVISINS